MAQAGLELMILLPQAGVGTANGTRHHHSWLIHSRNLEISVPHPFKYYIVANNTNDKQS
jgi:hypothetical protein